MQFSLMLYTASTWVLPVLIAVTLHEAAHGFVAHLLGDDTAYRQGRVTFNPLKHIDPFGTILLPAILLLLRSPILFGYAKPVPVNFGAVRHPRSDMVLVAGRTGHEYCARHRRRALAPYRFLFTARERVMGRAESSERSDH